MQFAFTDEQHQYRDIVARFCRDKSPSSRVRAQMASDAGFDRELWKQLCGELGMSGVHVPEALGGQGYGAVELGIAMEEMGRVMFCGPYFSSSVLATYALLNGATPRQQADWLPQLCAGSVIATLALAEPGGSWDPGAVTATAVERNGQWWIDGVKSYVLDGHVADLFIVAARAPGSTGLEGLSLFAVPATASGLSVKALKTLDATRRLSWVQLRGVQASLLGAADAAAAGLLRTLDQAVVALSAEMVGGAQALLDSAVAYAKLRVQFGRVIGSFQAIKHKCADMLLDVEFARSTAYRAAELAASDSEELQEAACIAKALASDAFMQAATDTLQIHGGIGFTWENDTQLYYKRARSSGALLGSAAEHRDRYVLRLAERQAGDRK
ncbi:MAG: acyl-CoA dehydrogenase family protein [Polaromonas sp.]|uniref:acyl-CoA dehydrogenase family protein n=1 Tax=Polaromonas sp. TaxID=1869339 RepID=UPI0027362B1E|nr:acyl-CoA dehydrogenase family protein [Polaromonas sp.]MDP3248845.1 acyl-CoA dehydrogenase family protein [Polaromonas sp.]